MECTYIYKALDKVFLIVIIVGKNKPLVYIAMKIACFFGYNIMLLRIHFVCSNEATGAGASA